MGYIKNHAGSSLRNRFFGEMLPVVLWAEAIKLIDTGEPFDIIFCTADRRKGTGGEIIELKGWVKVTGDQLKASGSRKIRRMAVLLKKDPDHNQNKTINIRDPRHPNKVRKIHTRLIGFLNGKRVVQ